MKTKGIKPLRHNFNYKIKHVKIKDHRYIDFIDTLGEDKVDCIRYRYYDTSRTVEYFSPGWNNMHLQDTIRRCIPNDIKQITEIVYEDHKRRNATKVQV